MKDWWTGTDACTVAGFVPGLVKLRKISPLLYGYIVWPELDPNRAELDPNQTKLDKMHRYGTVPVWYRGFLNYLKFRIIFYDCTILVLGWCGSVCPELNGSGWFRKPCILCYQELRFSDGICAMIVQRLWSFIFFFLLIGKLSRNSKILDIDAIHVMKAYLMDWELATKLLARLNFKFILD